VFLIFKNSNAGKPNLEKFHLFTIIVARFYLNIHFRP